MREYLRGESVAIIRAQNVRFLGPAALVAATWLGSDLAGCQSPDAYYRGDELATGHAGSGPSGTAGSGISTGAAGTSPSGAAGTSVSGMAGTGGRGMAGTSPTGAGGS